MEIIEVYRYIRQFWGQHFFKEIVVLNLRKMDWDMYILVDFFYKGIFGHPGFSFEKDGCSLVSWPKTLLLRSNRELRFEKLFGLKAGANKKIGPIHDPMPFN
jgi:hypothetical protein